MTGVDFWCVVCVHGTAWTSWPVARAWPVGST